MSPRPFATHFGFNELYLADLDAIAGQAPAVATIRRPAAAWISIWVDAGLRTARMPTPLWITAWTASSPDRRRSRTSRRSRGCWSAVRRRVWCFRWTSRTGGRWAICCRASDADGGLDRPGRRSAWGRVPMLVLDLTARRRRRRLGTEPLCAPAAEIILSWRLPPAAASAASRIWTLCVDAASIMLWSRRRCTTGVSRRPQRPPGSRCLRQPG